MKITRQSVLTRITHTKEINVTQKQLDAHANGELIQNVMPHLNEWDREFIISGATKEEWEKIYPPESETVQDIVDDNNIIIDNLNHIN